MLSESARKYLDKTKESSNYVICGTGHRPPRLGLTYTELCAWKLLSFVRMHFVDYVSREVIIISGGAQGFDQALAEAALINNIKLVMAVPFEGQEVKWPQKSQDKYKEILRSANEVIIVCDGGWSSKKFIVRDEFMVDCSDRVVAMYDGGKKGGTAHTVSYATKNNKVVDNLWSEWCNFLNINK